MLVWKWQTEIAITLCWTKLHRYKCSWQDAFVFWIRYSKAVFGLWAKPSLLASCFASQELSSTTSSWEEASRLPAASHLRAIPASLWVEGGVWEGRRDEESGAGCTKPVNRLPLVRVWAVWAVPMRRHLYIHRAGSSPCMELLLLFSVLIITLLIKIIILRYNA